MKNILIYWIIYLSTLGYLFYIDYRIGIIILIFNLLNDYRQKEIFDYCKALRKLITNK